MFSVFRAAPLDHKARSKTWIHCGRVQIPNVGGLMDHCEVASENEQVDIKMDRSIFTSASSAHLRPTPDGSGSGPFPNLPLSLKSTQHFCTMLAAVSDAPSQKHNVLGVVTTNTHYQCLAQQKPNKGREAGFNSRI